MKEKTTLPERVEQAFRAVPRGEFIETVYVRQRLHVSAVPTPVSRLSRVAATWGRVDRTDTQAWPELVHRDRALVTMLDERGLPLSSSSAPSLMAIMLGLLNVQPGQHVLEIGTGTGYNAALLSHLVGPAGRVTTMEVDAVTAEAASRRLRAWPNISVVTADGWHGYVPAAPFNRVICTAGLSCLCPDWIGQLHADGVFVASVQTEFASALTRLTRRSDPDRLTGGFVRGLHDGAFILLRSSSGCGNDFPDQTSEDDGYGLVSVIEQADAGPRHPLPDQLARLLLDTGPDFMLLIQLSCAALQFLPLTISGAHRPQSLLISCPEGAAVLHRPGPEDPAPCMRGSPKVARECLAAFRLWESAGAPAMTDYQLTLTTDGRVTAKVGGAELAAHIYRCRILPRPLASTAWRTVA